MTDQRSDSASWSPRNRVRRAVASLDVVESVRLLSAFEDDVIHRWRTFLQSYRVNVLPRWHGRLVKSLGDGMLLEFDTVLDAVEAVWAAHRLIDEHNVGCVPGSELRLRAGIHVAEIVVDDLDIYGAGVNLAARLATLAGPGETIGSVDARDSLINGLDVDIEDLGLCFLKNLDTPQRAFRLGPVGQPSAPGSDASAGARERVSVAVLPFEVHSAESAGLELGDILADDLIGQLSRQHLLHVVSRLSTVGFKGRHRSVDVAADRLGVSYLVHGTCSIDGQGFRLRAQIVSTRDRAVVWAETFDGVIRDVLMGDGAWVTQLTEQVCGAVVSGEVRRALTHPLPTLHSYTILLGAIAQMYRLSAGEFERSREMLQYLVDRHPRSTSPRAWLGKWHVMRVAQGWSPDPKTDALAARRVVASALELDPQHSLALAIDGMVCAYINKDLDAAAGRYEMALKNSPSESLAWVGLSGVHAYREEAGEAVSCALRAQRLSPLDPMKFYYDNFTSMAFLAQGEFDKAIEYGQRSLRASRLHGSTLRILAIAQGLNGQFEQARQTVRTLLQAEPEFTVSRFLDRYPGAGAHHAKRYASALLDAGLPS